MNQLLQGNFYAIYKNEKGLESLALKPFKIEMEPIKENTLELLMRNEFDLKYSAAKKDSQGKSN